MRIGVTFPQTEFGNDPIAIRDYAQTIEGLGFKHIVAYDHVLGASTAERPNWSGPYTSETPFHEPFVLFAYMAAVTQQLEFVPGVIVLPQRQTALVAKQAAELAVLSGGRLRLGVGIGWNEVEYEALGQNFRDRGVRSEEQMAVLRALWRDPVVTFHGRWHTINQAGINPLPVRRDIPLWIGGYQEATIQRVAKFGDGWFPWRPATSEMAAMVGRLRELTAAAGRDPASIGLEPQLSLVRVPEPEWQAYVTEWRALGATHLCINTMGVGLTTPQQHIDALIQVKRALEA